MGWASRATPKGPPKNTKTGRPQWQIDLLKKEMWTRHEAISACCGQDPKTVDVESAEYRRVAEEVDLAVETGELKAHRRMKVDG